MPVITSSDRTLLRSAPSVIEYYLAIMPMNCIFQGEVDYAEVEYGSVFFTYINGLGDYTSVTENETILVYSSTGYYKGKCRLRELTDTHILIGRGFDVDWNVGDIFKVVEVFEPWSKPTSIVVAPDDTLNFFKDTEIVWPGPTGSLIPKANAGVAFAGFLDDSQVDIEFGTRISGGQRVYDSFAVAYGASIASQSWYFLSGTLPSATMVSGTLNSQGVVFRFTGTGFGWVVQEVVDSNGITGTHRVPVWIFDDNNPPMKVIRVLRRQHKLRNSEVLIEAFSEGLTKDSIPDNVQAVLFTRECIDNELVTADLGCPFPGRHHIKFNGMIDSESAEWDASNGIVRFTLRSFDTIADQLPGYPTFVKDVETATNWHEIQGITVKSALTFLLQWHSTLNELLHLECEPEILIAGRNFKSGPPLRQVEDALLGDRGCLAQLGCSRYGSLHIRYDPQILTNALRGARETVLDLYTGEWASKLLLERKHRPQVSMLLSGGLSYDGSTATPHRSRSPGRVGLESGRQTRLRGLIVENQTDLNDKTGRLLGKAASPWGEVPVETWYDEFEPALQEYITLEVTSVENPRGYALNTDDLWVVRDVTISDVPAGTPMVNLRAEKLEEGYVGHTVLIPDPPTWTPPSPPPPPPPDEIIEPDPTYSEIVLVGTVAALGTAQIGAAGVCYCLDIKNNPEWHEFNGGLPDEMEDHPGEAIMIDSIAIDPNNPRGRVGCIAYTNVRVVEYEFPIPPDVRLRGEVWCMNDWAEQAEIGQPGNWYKAFSYEELETLYMELGLEPFTESFNEPEMTGLWAINKEGNTIWLVSLQMRTGDEELFDTFTTFLLYSTTLDNWRFTEELVGYKSNCFALMSTIGVEDSRSEGKEGHGDIAYRASDRHTYVCAVASGSAVSLGKYRQMTKIGGFNGGWTVVSRDHKRYNQPEGGVVVAFPDGSDVCWSPYGMESNPWEPLGTQGDDLVTILNVIDSIVLGDSGSILINGNIIAGIPYGAPVKVCFESDMTYVVIEDDGGWRMPMTRSSMVFTPSNHLFVLITRLLGGEQVTRIYVAPEAAPFPTSDQPGCLRVGLYQDYAFDSEFPGIYKMIIAHPTDNKTVFLCRSYIVADHATSETELIKMSFNGTTWTDVAGTGLTGLYTMGVRGITALAIATWEIN